MSYLNLELSSRCNQFWGFSFRWSVLLNSGISTIVLGSELGEGGVNCGVVSGLWVSGD